jgi:hypothetical protein
MAQVEDKQKQQEVEEIPTWLVFLSYCFSPPDLVRQQIIHTVSLNLGGFAFDTFRLVIENFCHAFASADR